MRNEENLLAAVKEAESLFHEVDSEKTSAFVNKISYMDSSDIAVLNSKSKKVANLAIEFKELLMMYSCAMKEIRTKLEILNTEYNVRYQRNPINSINTRLKRLASVKEKLERKGVAFSIANVKSNIYDVAGVRVVCSYVDDIYDIAETLKNQGDIELVTEKDYIANPKPNGYRSLHLIVRVPVFFGNYTEKVAVEIQIRTIAMDFWATLEHQLKYRQQLPDGVSIVASLKECADIIYDTDFRMLNIRKQIEASVGELTEDDVLFEKIKKLDLPIE